MPTYTYHRMITITKSNNWKLYLDPASHFCCHRHRCWASLLAMSLPCTVLVWVRALLQSKLTSKESESSPELFKNCNYAGYYLSIFNFLYFPKKWLPATLKSGIKEISFQSHFHLSFLLTCYLLQYLFITNISSFSSSIATGLQWPAVYYAIEWHSINSRKSSAMNHTDTVYSVLKCRFIQ